MGERVQVALKNRFSRRVRNRNCIELDEDSRTRRGRQNSIGPKPASMARSVARSVIVTAITAGNNRRDCEGETVMSDSWRWQASEVQKNQCQHKQRSHNLIKIWTYVSHQLPAPTKGVVSAFQVFVKHQERASAEGVRSDR